MSLRFLVFTNNLSIDEMHIDSSIYLIHLVRDHKGNVRSHAHKDFLLFPVAYEISCIVIKKSKVCSHQITFWIVLRRGVSELLLLSCTIAERIHFPCKYFFNNLFVLRE
mmetsp:Transcript_23098/g.56063  ORF Transcript_23098/g.56063 Transcript_23098/m.56063 type:complete len:109 (+) Transcript_23098:154-480(+)